ncbi:MAG: ComF family protein [Pseudomonadota bacterium]|nr:ComF family protein [Pseudomonadota bacterium]
MFTRLLSPGLSLLRLPGLASQCAVCHSWPAQQVCAPCVSRFTPALLRCARCALALPAGPPAGAGLSRGAAPSGGAGLSEGTALFGGRHSTDDPLCVACASELPALDGALAALSYAYPWSTLITRYKFGEQHGWAGFFASLLLQAPGVAHLFEHLAPQDWVLPLPLSDQRLQTRGFNQAWELASALARQTRTQAQADARLLLRVRHTRAQSELRRQDRLTNVKGAFQVDPLRVAGLEGRSVVLVDDVMTSGASLFEAAQVLRDAGAATVTAVVLARTAPA